MPESAKKPTEFGWFLMTKMEEAGLSQSELARRSGVPQSTISRYIFGTGNRDRDLLTALEGPLRLEPGTLTALNGYGTVDDVMAALRAVASIHIEITPLAERLNRVLGDKSALPETERRDLERIVDGLITQAEKTIAQQPKPTEHRTG